MEEANNEIINIVGIKPLDGRSDPARLLNKIISLDGIKDASERDLSEALSMEYLPPKENIFVCAFDVGQGSCAALISIPPQPYIYFDFGGGVGQNAHTYPKNLRFCFTNYPPVILSHWDMDHWISAYRHKEALDLKWIVPRQHVGPTHLKFALDLNAKKNLLIWPKTLTMLPLEWGTVMKLPPHRDRNHAGLIVVVSVNKGNVLCPGDARYSLIPKSMMTNLVGLLATHHGGNYRADRPPNASCGNRVIFSFGKGNTYHHPSDVSVSKHHSAGWTDRKDTPNANRIVPPAPVFSILIHPACGGQQCTLTINQ
jgi:hypothetical protein